MHCGRTLRLTSLAVLLYPQLPRSVECPGKYILIGRRQADVGCSRSAPSTGNGQKYIGLLSNKSRLLFR